MTQTTADVGLTVAEVAQQSGVAPSAVRYYDEQGLISAERTAGNQRRFRPVAVCQIEIALVAQRVGLTIREIRAYFDALPDEPEPEDWARFRESLVAEARRRIDDLVVQLDGLEGDERLCRLRGPVPSRDS